MSGTPQSNLMAEKHLILYGRDDCHLCHDMVDQLRLIQGELGFQLEIIDIDTDHDLATKYNALIPVLIHDTKEVCHYFLDIEGLRAALNC